MVSWTEPARELPVLAETDVLIVGGGSAGAAAAIAAARQGARTLLIEQQGFLGGTSTGALVTPMMSNHLQQRPLNQGIYLEVLQRLFKTGDADVYKDGNAGWFNPEMLKLVLEEMAVSAGAELFYHIDFADALVRDGALEGVIVETKSGRGVIRAHCTVDTSGDADVAYRAGVPVVTGRPDTGANQPMALRFMLGNVDLQRAQAYFETLGEFDYTPSSRNPDIPLWTTACTWDKDWPLKPLFNQAVEDGVLTTDDAIYFQIFTVPGRPGEVAFNCPRFDELTDSLDFRQRSRVQIEGKRSIVRLTEFCRRYLPGFEKTYIVQIAPMIGVRESRRIVGEYVLTSEDFFAARKFPDAIARNNYPIDIHSRDASGGLHFMKAGDYHDIPYRCLVPLNVDQLLVAGRCLSADFSAQGAVRIIPNCYAMGQAAGIAAALAVQQRQSPRSLDTTQLIETLHRQDAMCELKS